MRVIFTGSRRMTDDTIIRQAISELPRPPTVWVHGDGPGSNGAPGCDALVDRLARELGFIPITFPADWDGFLLQAGPKRNSDMANAGAGICLAFPDPFSRGTWDCLRKTAGAGIQTRIYPWGRTNAGR